MFLVHNCKSKIANQFGDTVTVVPGIVVVFSASAVVASRSVRCAQDMDAIVLPSQCNTNITAGVVTAVQTIVDAAPSPDTHIVLTFLSDGDHNQGPPLDDATLGTLRRQLRALNVTVVVVGVGASSNTSLGMKIKTNLENVTVPGLDSIYFAPSASDMTSVLGRLQQSLKAHVGDGAAVPLRCTTHLFSDTGKDTATVFVSTDTPALVLLRNIGESSGVCAMPPVLVLDAHDTDAVKVMPVAVVDLDVDTVTEVIDAQVVRLSQMGVARGAAAIRPQLDELKTFIQACSDAVASFSSEPLPTWSAMRPSQRAMALKVFRRSEVSFREQLNRVEELRCGVVNDSARQAAFLTGMQKKYGAKAVRRAGVLDVDMREVAAKIRGTIASLAASTASAGPGGPGPAPVEQTTDDTSFMSLNTPTEQLAEWTEVDPGTIEDPYAALVAYGMCGFPVRMAHTAAAQMDPWQTACLDVEPYLVDSGSLLLANRMQQVVMGPTRQPIVDVLESPHVPRHAAL